MKQKFSNLLAQGTIGPLLLQNRIVLPAMDQNNCSDEGLISEKTLSHYAERAAGGAGLLILETSAVLWPHGATSLHQPSLSNDAVIPGLRRLAECIHAYNSKMIVQACHHGKISGLDVSRDLPVLVPSLPTPPSDVLGMTYNTTFDELLQMSTLTGGKLPSYKEASEKELEEIINAFGEAALRIQRAGLDGIEIHAAHGYLISTFLSPAWNTRDDDWGGTHEKRAHLLCTIIELIRELCGTQFAIVVRIDGQEFGIENGITPADAVITAKLAEESGADAIHVSATSSSGTGVGFTDAPIPWKPCQYSDFARIIQSEINVPVIAVGRIEPDNAEELIAKGYCQFVSMGRQMLADPELPNNLINNTPERTRPCINCFICVAQNFWSGEPVCAVNPRLGNYEQKFEKVKESKHVVIVGGGPAGMECARSAANRGNQVTLLEQSQNLGGAARFSSLTTPKNGEFVEWLEREIIDGGVKIYKEFIANIDSVRSLKPDALVLATGSKRAKSDIKGAELPHVLSGDDLRDMLEASNIGDFASRNRKLSLVVMRLAKKLGFFNDLNKVRKLSHIWMPIGKKVVVIGGSLVGVELAHFLAKRKRQVTVLESTSVMATQMAHPRRWRTLHEAELSGVNFYNEIQVIEINNDSVIWSKEGKESKTSADSIILTDGIESDLSLIEEFSSLNIEMHIIGDADYVGYIEGAIRSGNQIGSTI